MARTPTSLSSLPFQVAVYFNGYFAVLFGLIELAVYIWKGTLLPYPPGLLGLEIFLLVCYFVIEQLRLKIGTKGNKTADHVPMLIFLAISLLLLAWHVYMITAQVYVLYLDYVLNLVAVAFLGLEFIMGSVAAWTFNRASS